MKHILPEILLLLLILGGTVVVFKVALPHHALTITRVDNVALPRACDTFPIDANGNLAR